MYNKLLTLTLTLKISPLIASKVVVVEWLCGMHLRLAEAQQFPLENPPFVVKTVFHKPLKTQAK